MIETRAIINALAGVNSVILPMYHTASYPIPRTKAKSGRKPRSSAKLRRR